MNTYEISFQFDEGELNWTDNILFDAVDVPELIKQVRTYIAQYMADRGTELGYTMSVLFAQIDDDNEDADERDITEEFPEDMLTEF
jgi:hypothetical protein